ncbi:MAG: ferrous iron transport protein B [Acidobacteria bacterium]|nr:ferrous iron transport protein B [Acidobacteriota bacterium]
MRFVLVGQPNSGKSTIFNAVAGYRSPTANFPGTSVTYTTSRVLAGDREVELVDLPGTYSLTSHDAAERTAQDFLASGELSVIVNVVDGTRLGRSLELTLQLMELGQPLVVALNMSDETRRKGIDIDAAALERELGVPVVPTIARRGLGLVELFETAFRAADSAPPRAPRHDREVERALGEIEGLIRDVPLGPARAPRLSAMKLVERDPALHGELERLAPAAGPGVQAAIATLEELHGWPADQVLSGARHALAHTIEERVSRSRRPAPGWRERVDWLLTHPVLGIPALLAILAALFYAVFGAGRYLEAPLAAGFDAMAARLQDLVPAGSVFGAAVQGIVLGLSGGVVIVLPYLLPFLVGLSLLEETGYLARMAYLLDGLMHRIGLHGKSIVPLVLGYGCSVPAVMATRILDSPRERRITAMLAVLVPCSARSVVILGLVGAVLGPWAALAVYIVNLAVTAGIAIVLERRAGPGPIPGLVLEVPDLRLPSVHTVFFRTWIALREFVAVAWPLLIVSSAVLSVLELAGAGQAINSGLAPLTVTLLGLPAAVGMTLVFGVLRKELSLMMLVQALGTARIADALAPAQVVAFALFVVFYVPCLATLVALGREVGWRAAGWVALLTLGLATALAVAGRFAVVLFA